ncbi:MAG: methyltransferase [Epsilonproteobacteria bacterium]|nr:methyltransferase [Campylobacterota bacterium]
MRLYQPESGYCFNSDTIFLYDFISQFTPKGEVLDVGAGCGVLGLLVARDFKKVKISGVEKQDILAKYAKKNAQENGIEYTLHVNDFLALDENKKYDYIISNPPFYHDGVQKSSNEMLFNARYNINLPLEKFFKKVSRILKPSSHFIFCYDESQFGLICAELDKVKMRVVDVRFVHPKKEKNASLVMIHARNGSKSMMKVHPPLFAFEGDSFSDEVQKIYERAQTESIKCMI